MLIPDDSIIVQIDDAGNFKPLKNVEDISEVNVKKWQVKFKDNPQKYFFNKEGLIYLDSYEKINLKNKRVLVKKEEKTELVEYVFCYDYNKKKIYKIKYKNSNDKNNSNKSISLIEILKGSDVKILDIPKEITSIWEYLKVVTKNTPINDNSNPLLEYYNKVEKIEKNPLLYKYLHSGINLSTYSTPQEIFYPFGCNASQKQAVEAALTNQVSIIEGPPGTGKTQTILNIIANLILLQKTILLVSNNNTAVQNISDKLQKEELDFMIAKLGKKDNQTEFYKNIPHIPHNINLWKQKKKQSQSDKKQAQKCLNKVSEGFELQRRKVELLSEKDALKTEKEYNERLYKNIKEKSNKKLDKITSNQLIKLLNRYEPAIKKGGHPGMFFRLKWGFKLSYEMFSYLKKNPNYVLPQLYIAYYKAKEKELNDELEKVNQKLDKMKIQEYDNKLRSYSIAVLKNFVAQKYSDDIKRRSEITERSKKEQPENFFNEFPIVTSTCYSARNCIESDILFDYVIMDEASQIDLKTGVLALSCAKNMVVVGDEQQLPNIITSDEEVILDMIKEKYSLFDERYNCKHSFLRSCIEVFSNSPKTMLCEHYRCHPKIIEFCNKKFYNGQLKIMTEYTDDKDVLKVIKTVQGNHQRGRGNQREADVIKELTEKYKIENQEDIYVITPYKEQKEKINDEVRTEMANTVHKYQGQECDTIIMSMVDNEPTDFSDNPNLLNVAISRAKKHLIVVMTGNEISNDTNLQQLVDYIQYNNFAVTQSPLRSVFDILYKQYTQERLNFEKRFEKKYKRKGLTSEYCIYDLLKKSIKKQKLTNIDVAWPYPLSKLIPNADEMYDKGYISKEEKDYINSFCSHIDFLIYNTLTKQPLKIIEVDGHKFHNQRKQQDRDSMKDNILNLFNFKPIRLKTDSLVTEKTIDDILKTACQG